MSSRASSPARPDSGPQGAPVCVLVTPGDRLDIHRRVRHAVFVDEQGVFAVNDHDAHDDDPRTLHGLALVDGGAAGAVRLYPLDDLGIWKGDRLAVLPDHRRGHVGAALVRFAVRTAAQRGGVRMHALIQLPNVRFFTALRWEPDGPVAMYHGRQHQPMVIDLTRLRAR